VSAISWTSWPRRISRDVSAVSRVDPRIVAELKRTVAPGYVHDAPSEIISYSFDGTFQQRRPDLAVSGAGGAPSSDVAT